MDDVLHVVPLEASSGCVVAGWLGSYDGHMNDKDDPGVTSSIHFCSTSGFEIVIEGRSEEVTGPEVCVLVVVNGLMPIL